MNPDSLPPLAAAERVQVDNLYWSFFGGFCQQTPQAILSLNRLLNAVNFDRIIELGSHTCGLSALALYCLRSRLPAQSDDAKEPSLFVNTTHHKSPKEFWTFDYVRRDKNALALLEHLGAQFRQWDTLYNEQNIDFIRGLISAPGTTLLLCDGGCKTKELELCGPALKSGDFVMLDDYAANEDVAVTNRELGIWRGWEVALEPDGNPEHPVAIAPICAANHITQVYAEEFDPVVWFCGRKG